jgi:integrase
VSGRAASATDALQRENGAIIPWVFHRNGRPIKDMYKAWRQACRDADCPGRIPHDFRRTAVGNLFRAGVPEGVDMQMTGHKTRSVFKRYNIVSKADLVSAAEKLAKFEAGTSSGKRQEKSSRPMLATV